MGNAALENKRVRGAITRALFQLMKEKNFSEISVSDIVSTAGVARASFYRNFETKEAVIENYLNWMHNDIIDFVSHGNLPQPKSRDRFIEYMENTLAHILTQKSYVLTLYRNGFGSEFQRIADIYIEEMAGDMLYSSADKYLLYCFSGAAVNMLIHWLLDGAVESPHELAIACTDLFLDIFRMVFEKKEAVT